MSLRRLLLDAGNTRLKWAVVEDRRWHAHGSAAYSDLSGLARVLEPGLTCHIASVADERDEARINALLAPAAITPVWLGVEARFLDLENGYANPQQLGVDRWMGLIAARQRSCAATLVVSVGTAMTVDALSAEGLFVGGLIVPGVALMRQALQRGVARVAEVTGSWQAFPRTTADAVQSGIVAALSGAVQTQFVRLAETQAAPPHCIVTGGDADSLLAHLAVPAEHVPALVLEGIERVADEDRTG